MRTLRLVAADAGFYSGKRGRRQGQGRQARVHPQLLHQKPGAQTRAEEALFRNGQKWRTGCEGRISVVKRRHGLNRSRYKGEAGMKRWVGLGVIADNLVNISRVIAKQPGP